LAADPIVEMDNVVAGYGAMTTIIGPNGAGKSTVFKTIFGLLRPRSGTVRVSGRDATRWSQRDLLAAGVCYIPQGRNIFPELSVRHNIELGAVSAGPQIKDVPARLEAALDRFPALRRKADRQASTLSGGEQKQLEIVRGLLLDPSLILIDEPSIGLSPLMVQETFSLLRQLRDKGVSILMIEQNARSALKMSDYGLVLELGRTRMHDTAPAILGDPRVAQLFLGGVIEG
jgi:branched-chain amino acid transport system ATP-binding protein